MYRRLGNLNRLFNLLHAWIDFFVQKEAVVSCSCLILVLFVEEIKKDFEIPGIGNLNGLFKLLHASIDFFHRSNDIICLILVLFVEEIKIFKVL